MQAAGSELIEKINPCTYTSKVEKGQEFEE